MKIWGYWATFGWSVLAFIVGQFLALAVLVWWRINDLDSIRSEVPLLKRVRIAPWITYD